MTNRKLQRVASRHLHHFQRLQQHFDRGRPVVDDDVVAASQPLPLQNPVVKTEPPHMPDIGNTFFGVPLTRTLSH